MKRRHSIPLVAAVLSGCLLLLGPPALAGKGKSCSRSARVATKACKAAARSDAILVKGRCLQESDESVVGACKDEEREARDEAGTCKEQRGARLDVCDRLGEEPYDPPIDPNAFLTPAETAAQPNAFFPLVPGNTWHYASATEIDTVVVTGDTREIMGVTTIVVHDVVEVDGTPIEDTDDFYAQDVNGNVWYFGEVARNYEDGFLVDLEGSWRAGVDHAKPGIVMKAAPAEGDFYRQEYLLGEAEDVAEVTSVTGTESVPGGSCDGTCLVTREFTPIEPDVAESKYYLAGVGLLLEVDLETGERVELTGFMPAP